MNLTMWRFLGAFSQDGVRYYRFRNEGPMFAVIAGLRRPEKVIAAVDFWGTA